ncbi:MAG: hypothetical protein WA628_18400 [Terriglobales bacterium]
MSLKRLAVAVLVSVCAFAAHATAQKNELSGLVGRTFISDQVITTSTFSDNKLRFGNGLSFEGNLARRVMGGGLLSLTLEVPFVFNPDEDLHLQTNPVSAGYKSFFVTPAARLNVFSGSGVSPWVSVGGGVGHFSGSTARTGGETGTTTGVFQIGGGLDVRLIRKFSLRAEVRDFWSGVPKLGVTTDKSRQTNLFVGAGVVWHF